MGTFLDRCTREHFTMICIALVAGCAVAGYGASLKNGFVRWDDGYLITENAAVRETSLHSIKTVFTTYDPELYIPLTLLSYQVDQHLGGGSAITYHVQNLFWHTVSALLIVAIGIKLTGRRWASLAAGLLFVIHPLNVEAVAWASARKDVLSTALALASIWTWLRYRESEERRTYWIALGLFVLALLSKVMVITVPGIMLLLDRRSGERWSIRTLKEYLPYAGVALLFAIIAWFGKRGVVQDVGILDVLLMAPKSALFYIGKLLVPLNLAVLYPYTAPITMLSPDFAIPIALLIIIVVAAFMLRRSIPELGIFLAIAGLALLPTILNFAKNGDVYIASDRYAYFPSIALFLFLTNALQSWWEHRSAPAWRAQITDLACAAAIVSLGFLTYRQSLVWQDTRTLFTHALAVSPNAHMAHNNIGNVLRRDGDLDAAIAEFNAALAIREHSKTLSNVGAVLRKQKKFSEAQAAYDRALTVDPKSAEAYFGLGLVAADQLRIADAKTAYVKAIELQPDYAEVYNNIGSLAVDEGKLEDAEKAFRTAVTLDPNLTEAHYNLAVVAAKRGEVDTAIAAYETVIVMQPIFIPARINLGILYYDAKRVEDAAMQFETVLQLDPGNARARTALQQIRGF